MPRNTSGHRPLSTALLLAGLSSVLLATASIWVARAIINASVYVSELGATGAPTAQLFNTALLMLGCGVLAVGIGTVLRRTHPTSRRGRWIPLLLIATGTLFALASRVPCSAGCPVPGSANFAAADIVHLSAAIGGFTFAGLAMIITASDRSNSALQRGSLIAVVLMGATASAGGLLSLGGTLLTLGALLEFVAMSIAVLWFVPYVIAQVSDRRAATLRERASRAQEHRASSADQLTNSPSR
ncbi:MAG: DUF998 domain-containing protein [Mycetocola sp.]